MMKVASEPNWKILTVEIMKDHQLHYTNQTEGRKYTRKKQQMKEGNQQGLHTYESVDESTK